MLQIITVNFEVRVCLVTDICQVVRHWCRIFEELIKYNTLTRGVRKTCVSELAIVSARPREIAAGSLKNTP